MMADEGVHAQPGHGRNASLAAVVGFERARWVALAHHEQQRGVDSTLRLEVS